MQRRSFTHLSFPPSWELCCGRTRGCGLQACGFDIFSAGFFFSHQNLNVFPLTWPCHWISGGASSCHPGSIWIAVQVRVSDTGKTRKMLLIFVQQLEPNQSSPFSSPKLLWCHSQTSALQVSSYKAQTHIAKSQFSPGSAYNFRPDSKNRLQIWQCIKLIAE